MAQGGHPCGLVILGHAGSGSSCVLANNSACRLAAMELRPERRKGRPWIYFNFFSHSSAYPSTMWTEMMPTVTPGTLSIRTDKA